MATPFESALLNLYLFDLRREPVLREAREWFLREFNPESVAELVALVSGQRNASFRMVLGYWDMAASFVTTGAIDADAFRAAHGEIIATFSKIHPVSVRNAGGERGIRILRAHREGSVECPGRGNRPREPAGSCAGCRESTSEREG